MAKRLITEATIRGLAAGGELVLGRGDLVTPLALDLAFAKGIAVRRDSGSGTEGATPPPAGAPAARLGAALLAREGTYVVKVAGGRAEVFALEGGAPRPVPLEGGAR